LPHLHARSTRSPHSPALPAFAQPSFEEDFCTFLLSDVEYGGVNAHTDLEKKVAAEAAAAAAAAAVAKPKKSL